MPFSIVFSRFYLPFFLLLRNLCANVCVLLRLSQLRFHRLQLANMQKCHFASVRRKIKSKWSFPLSISHSYMHTMLNCILFSSSFSLNSQKLATVGSFSSFSSCFSTFTTSCSLHDLADQICSLHCDTHLFTAKQIAIRCKSSSKIQCNMCCSIKANSLTSFHYIYNGGYIHSLVLVKIFYCVSFSTPYFQPSFRFCLLAQCEMIQSCFSAPSKSTHTT